MDGTGWEATFGSKKSHAKKFSEQSRARVLGRSDPVGTTRGTFGGGKWGKKVEGKNHP